MGIICQSMFKIDHSPPSCAKIKNAWIFTSTTYTSSWHGVQMQGIIHDDGFMISFRILVWFL
jgi:hypothetical protein